jgi:hypothetical protein
MFEDESFMKFALEQLKPEIYNRLKNLLWCVVKMILSISRH